MNDKLFDENEVKLEEMTKQDLSGFWSEKVFVITEDYEIKGYIFMPKVGKKNRLLSDILNSKRRFVAIKDAQITCRKSSDRKVEVNNFIQLNLNAIILIRPILED